MTELIINKVSVDLPEGFNPKIVEKSSLFSWEMQGGFTLPFSLPRTATNRAVFGYIDVLSVIGNREQYWAAKVKKDGLELFEGTLRITSVNEVFECELAIPPGNIPPEIWEQSLRKFDFGKETFPSTVTKSNFWSVAIPEPDVKDFGANLQNQNTYQVFINGAKIYEFINHDTNDINDKLAIRANSFVFNFNNEMPGLKLYVSDKGFGFRGASILGNLINAVKIVYLVVPIGGVATVINEWEMSQVSYEKINEIKESDYLTKPYCFKTIRNDAFYDRSANEFWNGKINLIEDGIVKTNTEATLTTYTLVPFMRLRYVFEKIASLLGYTIKGNFLDHANTNKILIYTNISTDLQCPEAYVPFNIHKPTINFADYLPDVTLKAFVDWWKARLGINFLWDYSEKTLRIDFIESILEANRKHDWRDKLPENVNIETDGTEYVFKYEDDIQAEFTTIEVNRTNPPKYYEGCLKDVNDFGSSTTEGQNPRILPMPQLHIYEYYRVVKPRANNGGQTNDEIIKQKYYIANHKGVSPLFNQSGVEVKARIFFQDVDYSPVEWSLSFFAADGIKAKLLNRLLVFLKQYRIIEFYTRLSLVELAQKDWYIKRNFGIDFYPLEFEYSLADGEDALVRLLGE